VVALGALACAAQAPGLTGPWQVLGRNAIPFEEMVRLDYLDLADWSLWNDLKLVLRTVPVVLGRRCCYYLR